MIKIIPAIDIIEGKTVRLSQGDFSKVRTYDNDPLDLALSFQNLGLRKLHLVDLEGAKSNHIINHETLRKISEGTGMEIDFGGGIKSDKDIRLAFDCGAFQVTVGSLAVTNKKLVQEWIRKYGAEKIILGADVMEENIATHGWKKSSGINIWDFLREYISLGIEYVICTDISKDGMLSGPSHHLYKKILDTFPYIKLIASGGVTSINDVKILQNDGLYGAIIGKAIYEGKINLRELKQELTNAN